MGVGRVMAMLESAAVLVGQTMSSRPRLALKGKSDSGPVPAWAGRRPSLSGISRRDQPRRRHLSVFALLAVLAVSTASAGVASSAAAATTSSTT
jgi:hypothetical protein